MFVLKLGETGLRPLAMADIERMYGWQADLEIEMLSGWAVPRARAAFEAKWEGYIREPREDLRFFGIEHAGELVGRADLALIDREQRRAFVGFFLGERSSWGKGIATTAVRLLLDYAFTVENLERIQAETYDFNARSQRLLERAGFVPEGILRRHEWHHGQWRNMHLYGLLKEEFYERFPTVFPVP